MAIRRLVGAAVLGGLIATLWWLALVVAPRQLADASAAERVLPILMEIWLFHPVACATVATFVFLGIAVVLRPDSRFAPNLPKEAEMSSTGADEIEGRLEQQVRGLRRVALVIGVFETLLILGTVAVWVYGIVQLARDAPGGGGPSIDLGVILVIALCEAVRRQSRIVSDLAETVKGIV